MITRRLHHSVRVPTILSRRKFLGLVSMIVCGADTFLSACSGTRKARSSEIDDVEQVVRQLCDHFLPANNGVPGARALGVDQMVIDRIDQEDPKDILLKQLVHNLIELKFVTWPATKQHDFLELNMPPSDQRPIAMVHSGLSFFLSECVSLYYTKAQAWEAIAYDPPHPFGYASYGECPKQT